MTAAQPAPVSISPDQPVPAEFDLLCDSCGYSLIGLMVERCPECGEPFDATALPLARVPWLYRKRLGRVGAYLQTLRLALLSPRAFAAELCRPVRISAQDAHRFRLLTIHVAAFGVVLGVGGFMQYTMSFWPPRVMSATLVAICIGVWLAAFVFFRLATDLPTFIWRGLPGRSHDLSPLHQYAAAPLALLLPGAVLFLGLVYGFGKVMVTFPDLSAIGMLVIAGIGLGVLPLSWLVTMIYMRSATRCRLTRVAALGLYLPAHWLMMFLLVFLGAIAAIYYAVELFG